MIIDERWILEYAKIKRDMLRGVNVTRTKTIQFQEMSVVLDREVYQKEGLEAGDKIMTQVNQKIVNLNHEAKKKKK